jgi:hypothetical protein
MIDHRFFYSNRGIGNYTCGIAREAVACVLWGYGDNSFGVTQKLTSLEQYIDNESVIGFFLECAILQTIQSNGLKVDGLSNAMPMITYRGFPTFDTNRSLALYVPCSYNFRGIDGIILRMDREKRRAYLFPLQVTVAKRHGDSEQSFFNDWDRWVRGFEGFEVEVIFLWITAKDPSVEDKDEAYRSHRSGKVLKNPAFCSRNISFEDVNKTVWDRYAKALKEKKNRDQNMLATL